MTGPRLRAATTKRRDALAEADAMMVNAKEQFSLAALACLRSLRSLSAAEPNR